MSKVLLFSDAHVHPHKRSNDRLNNCLEALDWAFYTAEERGIDTILFLGDLFHDRQKIDILTYQRVFEIFEKHLGVVVKQIYLLLGNHDLWHLDKWDVSSVFPLRSIPGVIVVDSPCTLPIKGKEISFLPYTKDPIRDLQKIENKSDWKMLCGHVAIHGAVWNVPHSLRAEVEIEHDGDMVQVDADVFKEWDQVFLGHYHAQQKLGDIVEYIGSLLQFTFGEAFQHKHIVILDLETHEKEYVRNEFSPQHFIIHKNDVAKYPINGNFVKVMVDDLADSDVADLRHNLLNTYKPGSLQIAQIEQAADKDKDVVSEAKNILDNKPDMLKTYIDIEAKKGDVFENANIDKLLEIGLLICNTNTD